jgi:hypothetical protein
LVISVGLFFYNKIILNKIKVIISFIYSYIIFKLYNKYYFYLNKNNNEVGIFSMFLKKSLVDLKKAKKRDYTDLSDIRKHPLKSKQAHPEFFIVYTDKKNGDLLIATGNYTHSKRVNGIETIFINYDKKLKPVYYLLNNVEIQRISTENEKHIYLDYIQNYKKDIQVGLIEQRGLLDLQVGISIEKMGYNISDFPLVPGNATKSEHIAILEQYNLNKSIIEMESKLPTD